MVEFWIQMSSFLILLLHFTAVTGRSDVPVVRVGDEVTLPCKNVTGDQDKCERTWLFNAPRSNKTVVLIERGQIAERAKTKSDRLSVTQNYSLVIKKVRNEDAGSYTCRQFESGYRDSRVSLSVVTMTEHNINDQVELNCSVSTYERCPHTVKWLYVGNNVDEDNKDLQTSQSVCSASVRLQSSNFIHKSNSDLLKCNVTDGDKVHLFPFRLQPSGDNTTTTTASNMERGTITSPINDDSAYLKGLRFIIVSVGLAALIIIVVAVNVWTRTKGRKTQTDENMVADDEDDGAVNYENVTSSV